MIFLAWAVLAMILVGIFILITLAEGDWRVAAGAFAIFIVLLLALLGGAWAINTIYSYYR